MPDIFSKYKEAIVYASQLALLRETEAAVKLCRKIAKSSAEYNGIDLIEMFYGDNYDYNNIENVANAITSIYISKCLSKIYDIICLLRPANQSVGSWANNKSNSNEQLLRVFSWLGQTNRKIDEKDCIKYFKPFFKVLNLPAKINFKMSSKIEKYTLIEIIKGLVRGSIRINNGALI